MQQVRSLQTGERFEVAASFTSRHEGVERFVRTRELLESSHEGDERGRLQEDETAIAVMVRQRTEGLLTKRDLQAHGPRARGVERSREQSLHDLIDAAKTVDGDLLHQQLFAEQLFDDSVINHWGIWCHETSFSLFCSKARGSRCRGRLMA